MAAIYTRSSARKRPMLRVDLTGAHRWELYEAIHERVPMRVLAERFGVNYKTIWQAVHALGLKPHAKHFPVTEAGQKRADAWRDRRKEVVKLRERDMTGSEIGARFGISHQRIYQILREEGRLDLCGHKKRSSNPPVTQKCSNLPCGKEFTVPYGWRYQQYCCQRCASQHFWSRHSPIDMKLVERILEGRRAGIGWNSLSLHLGLKHTPEAHRILRRYQRSTSDDISWAFKPVPRSRRKAKSDGH
ncbi:MAG: hypothetical protein ACR2RE_12960 [Geminicoccaceae bacterium]